MKYINLLITIVFLVWISVTDSYVSAEEHVVTNYDITLEEAVDIQVNVAGNPITDLYKDAPAFLQIEDLEFVGPNKISVLLANMRTEPALDAEVAYRLAQSTSVQIIDVVSGDVYQDNPLWYKIAYNGENYYIHTDLVTANQVRTVDDTKIYEGPEKDQHTFGELKEGETLTIAKLDTQWIQVYYQYWRSPKPEDVKKFLEPDRTDENMFQHIRLDESIGVSASELNSVLEGKGILEGLGQAFIDGGKKHSINEVYLISHAFHETAFGTSELANGIEVGINDKKEPVVVTEKNREDLKKIKTVYNMFGIGAADSCPLDCGAKTAYENKWFTPEKAIQEGAAWIGKDYIYNEFEQNTLYKMKWNPKMAEGHYWKQYATDIGWAEKQTAEMKEIYDQLENPQFSYDVPEYKE